MKKNISTTLLERRQPEIGKIKIGRKGKKLKTKDGASMRQPVKLDHFVITTRARGDDENFVLDAEAHRAVGSEAPTKLKIRLMYDTPEENFFSAMQRYAGRTLVRECDGEEYVDLEDGVTGECPRKEDGSGCTCKPYGRLSVILEDYPNFGGLHVFRTTGWESVRNILSTLEMFYEHFGSLRGLPLYLVCYQATDTFKVNGQPRTGTSTKVGLLLRADFQVAAEAALEFHQKDQISRRKLKQLAAGTKEALDEVDREEAGDIIDEFFPEDAEEEEGGEAKTVEAEEETADGVDVLDEEADSGVLDAEPVSSEDGPPVVEGEVEEEGDEEGEGDEDDATARARKKYHARLTEMVADPRIREFSRKAYHWAHPNLPDSESEWREAHYAIATPTLMEFGQRALDKAVERMADADPADPEDVERLKELLDVSGGGIKVAEQVWWVIDSGVGSWVSLEVERMKLEGIFRTQEADGTAGAGETEEAGAQTELAR